MEDDPFVVCFELAEENAFDCRACTYASAVLKYIYISMLHTHRSLRFADIKYTKGKTARSAPVGTRR